MIVKMILKTKITSGESQLKLEAETTETIEKSEL